MFFGIPYAQPPVGNYRFRHPIPVPAWRGQKDATVKPNACTQGIDTVFGDHPGPKVWNPNTRVSEDCLYLNVWRPTDADYLKRKAVMIWIYGGSYLSGSSSLDVYDARYLVSKMDVIVVSMQYRVGSLGFLSFNTAEAPGNAGMMDQVMALEWVQRNIEAFGGDRNNVTIFGESAGSASVGMHLLSSRSRDKFHRAILQSGAPQAPWATVTQKEAVRRANALAKAMNCSRESIYDIIYCLKDQDADKFPRHEYDPDVTRGFIGFPFVPVIDGSFLSESPETHFRTGNFKRTNILAGSNTNEGFYFLVYGYAGLHFDLNSNGTLSRTQFHMILHNTFQHFPQYPQTLNSFGQDAIVFQYTPWKNPDSETMNRDAVDQAVGDLMFVCPVVDLAEHYAKRDQKVYYYDYNHRASYHHWPEWMGVLHGDEIMFAFGEPFNPRYNYTKNEQKLSEKIMRYWTNFAKTG